MAFRLLVSFGRYVLVTAGPVFTEEMWRLACCALQDAFSATLKPVKVKCSEHARAGSSPPQLPGGPARWPPAFCLAPPSRRCHLKSCRGWKSSGWVSTIVPDTVTLSDSRQSQEPRTQTHPVNACCFSPGSAGLLPQRHRELQRGRLPGEGGGPLLLPQCRGRVLAHPSHGSAGKGFWSQGF